MSKRPKKSATVLAYEAWARENGHAVVAKPKPLKLENLTATPIRPPNKKHPARWTWRVVMYIDRNTRPTVGGGAHTRDEMLRVMGELLASESPVQKAAEEKAAGRANVATVRDLMEVYLGSLLARVELYRQEDADGEEAIRIGAATEVKHGKDGLAPQSFRTRKTASKGIVSLLGDVRLSRLTRDVLDDYRNQRQKTHASGTVKGELDVLSWAWNWGRQDGRDYTSGITKPRFPSVVYIAAREKVTPTRKDVRRVLRGMPEGWERDLLTVQSIVGCRIGALGRLTARDVNLSKETLRLKVKGHDRTVRVPSAVMDVLRPRVEAAAGPDAGIWPVANATAIRAASPPPPLRKGRTKLAPAPFYETCIRLGIKPWTSHGFRRLVSNEWIASGVNVAVYARVMGHSAVQAIQAYAVVGAQDELAAFKLAARVKADNVRLIDSARTA